jgi:hypothetical protein
MRLVMAGSLDRQDWVVKPFSAAARRSLVLAGNGEMTGHRA